MEDMNTPIRLKYNPCAIGPLIPGIVLPHVHDAIELIFTTSGTATAICNGIEYPQTPGSVFFAASNEVHYFTNRTNDTNGLVLDIETGALLGGANQFSQGVPTVHIWEDPDMKSKIWTIVNYMMDNMYTLDQSSVNLLSCSLLTLLLNHIELIPISRDNKNITKIITYCEEHFTEPLSLAILSDELGLSVSYISRFFSNTFKMSFSDYINGLRLGEAIALLNDSKLTISKISGRAGFPTIRTFNKAFLKHYGMTPSEYRKLEQKSNIEIIKQDKSK